MNKLDEFVLRQRVKREFEQREQIQPYPMVKKISAGAIVTVIATVVTAIPVLAAEDLSQLDGGVAQTVGYVCTIIFKYGWAVAGILAILALIDPSDQRKPKWRGAAIGCTIGWILAGMSQDSDGGLIYATMDKIAGFFGKSLSGGSSGGGLSPDAGLGGDW